MLVEIRIPAPAARQRRRLPQARAQGRRLRHRRRRRPRRARRRRARSPQAGIGLTNVGPTPIRAAEAEAALVGDAPDEPTLGRRGARWPPQAAEPVERFARPGRLQAGGRATLTAAGPAHARSSAPSSLTSTRGRRATARMIAVDDRPVTMTVNGDAAPRRGRAPAAAGPLHPREPGADRHPHRLRHHQLRRLHRPARRQAGQVVHHVRRPGRRPRDRRPSRAWRTAPTLHPIQEGFWQEHGLQCGFCTPGMMMTASPCWSATRPDRARDPRGDLRQPLPLHRLRQHRAAPSSTRAREERCAASVEREHKGSDVRRRSRRAE